MLSFNTGCAVVLFCLAVPSLVSAGGSPGLSKLALNFLALYQGDFDNSQEILTGGYQDHGSAKFKLVPVEIPVLGPAPVIYDEYVANGKVEDMTIFVLSEQANSAIHLDHYKFTDPSLWKPGQYNVSSLADLKIEDLRDANCTSVFRRLAKAVYVGAFAICDQLVNGMHPTYGQTFVCDKASSVRLPTSPLASNSPYIYERKGDRYPTFGYPDTYDVICGRD